jgi:tRNA/rRNA methyltransferase
MGDGIDLSAVRIVLSHTSHPGNIGAAARAMKTMGLSRLYLVNPKHFPHPDALALATGAADMLDKAVVCESLDVALAGTVHEVVSCRQACQRLVGETPRGEVALVFGTERAGLTIAEIGKCGLIATIPTNEAYASLNLAQAVQVFAYELRMALDIPRDVQPDASVKMAAHDDVERFYEHLEQVLYETEFLDPAQPNRLMQRLRRLFARARLEKEEVNILRGILSAMQDKGQ